MYAAGETVVLFADLFPSTITPLPPDVRPGVKLRTIITERMLTVGWRVGSNIYRVDLDMTEEQTQLANFRGGAVGPYWVVIGGGCKCGAGSLSSWVPYPGVTLTQEPRMEQARLDAKTPSQWGIPSPRYSRIR